MNEIRSAWKRIAGICLICGLSAGTAFAALPEGATPLMYIQGYNQAWRSPYLDTGWTIQPHRDVFEAVIELVDATTGAFWSTRDPSYNSSCTLFNYGGSYFRVDYFTVKSEISRNVKLYPGIPYTITVSNGTTVVSNGARADVPPPTTTTFTNTPGPLILFASCHYDSEGTRQNVGNFSTHRLHSFKIWRDGVLVRDFVPVRTADNVVTLADAVEGGVLTPLGTGTFGASNARDMTVSPLAATVSPQLACEGATFARPALSVTDAATGDPLLEGVDYETSFERYGSDEHGRATVTPLIGSAHARKRALTVEYDVLSAPPPGYTRLEYVQGDGHSHWVTDYLPQPTNDEIEVDIAFTDLETAGLFCARGNGNQRTWSFCFIKQNNGQYQRRLDYNTANCASGITRPFPLGPRFRLTVANKTALFSNGDIINVDTQDRQQPELAEAANYMAIFAYYSNGTGNNLASWSTQRLYSFKVRRGGKLIHDWIPVRTPQGVVTLYDLVANEALTPLGTGAFIAGPAVNTGVEIAPIPVQTLPANGACTPAPVVTQAGTGVRLVAGTDYTVSYADNGQPGLATLTVTGAGAFAGAFAVTVPFNISPAPPSGVTRLAYIQGDAASYLLTDWTINPQTDRVEAEIELTDPPANAVIWCARNAFRMESFTLFRLEGDTFRCDCGDGGFPTIGWAGLFPRGVKIPIKAHGADFTVGSIRSRRKVAASFTATGGPLMLFASYYGGTSNNIEYHSRHRLYEFCVFRQGALVRRWVPVRTLGGVATVCDLMTGTTITPSGSGSFIAGPDFAEFDLTVADQAWDGEPRHAPKPFVAATNRTTGVALEPGRDYTVSYTNNAAEGWARAIATGVPGTAYAGQEATADFRVIRALTNGYERLEYLQGDGYTALLTDYVPQPSTDAFTVEFEMHDMVDAKGLFCARGGSPVKSWSLCWQNAQFRFDSHTNILYWTAGSPMTADTRYTMRLVNKTAKSADGSSREAPDVASPAGGPMMMLGYYGANDGTYAPATPAAARIYGCHVSRSGVIIHDWVPVRTPEGMVTLYDRVTDTIPVLKGTGKLIAGPVWKHEGPVVIPPGTIIIFR